MQQGHRALTMHTGHTQRFHRRHPGYAKGAYIRDTGDTQGAHSEHMKGPRRVAVDSPAPVNCSGILNPLYDT